MSMTETFLRIVGRFRIFETNTRTRLVGYWLTLADGTVRFKALGSATILYGRLTRGKFVLDSGTTFYGRFV